MPRINLTVSDETFEEIQSLAKTNGSGFAGTARKILLEGIARRRALALERELEEAYRSQNSDPEVREILDDMMPLQDELLSKEEFD